MSQHPDADFIALQAARVLREVAWALAYAQSARIVHRDVSAENILLERGSERAIVYGDARSGTRDRRPHRRFDRGAAGGGVATRCDTHRRAASRGAAEHRSGR